MKKYRVYRQKKPKRINPEAKQLRERLFRNRVLDRRSVYDRKRQEKIDLEA